MMRHNRENKKTILIFTAKNKTSLEQLQNLLVQYFDEIKFLNNFQEINNFENNIFLAILPFDKGFQDDNIIFITENDILPIFEDQQTNKNIEDLLNEENEIKQGDLVIHLEYGLGKFVGLEHIKILNLENDFVKIEYANQTNLLIPIENFYLVSKYSEYNENTKLSSLGSTRWNEKKTKIKQELKRIATELIELNAKRKILKAPICLGKAGEYEEFCAEFPFNETADQLKVIEEIKKDLAFGYPMDRLLCGDVGFGKTEVAMRASFIVANDADKQVVIVCPTSLLCKQHYNSFLERFKNTSIKICILSRNNTPTENNKIKKSIQNGGYNIIIATHSIFTKGMEFKNLVLTIIDEEQRFGVKQKEKLKEVKNNCHSLLMSATPIPRTLEMSVAGLKDISIIATPPKERMNINTFVYKMEPVFIRESINREIFRDGLVFIVVPRISDIKEVEEYLKVVLPEIKHRTLHGQMLPKLVDETMNDFYNKKFSILIATTIIESGIDIAEANTMIIYKANHFGLAQLYQLRGRVGRSDKQGWCYLVTKKNEKLTENAKRRLEIMKNITSLNAGFRIASEDMEIRGYGNIAGDDQSGFINEIGVSLYNRMLKDSIKNIKNDNINTFEDSYNVEIKLNLNTFIPTNYINNIALKMKYYKKISNSSSIEMLNEVENDLKNRFGEMPEELKNLIFITRIRLKCYKLNINKIELKSSKNKIIISFNDNFKNNDNLINFVNKNIGITGFDNNKSIYFAYQNNKINQLLEERVDLLEKYLI